MTIGDIQLDQDINLTDDLSDTFSGGVGIKGHTYIASTGKQLYSYCTALFSRRVNRETANNRNDSTDAAAYTP